jgi:hypothetical protein
MQLSWGLFAVDVAKIMELAFATRELWWSHNHDELVCVGTTVYVCVCARANAPMFCVLSVFVVCVCVNMRE